ncbi:MAG: glycosyltransferase [Clostridiales bacterium]|nr:glycosyltransferase [Clostridiales bacterium]
MNIGVSVVIPVYNCSVYIGKAIESVLSQTQKPLEIIVADDGSDDGSAAVAASFPGVRVVSLPHRGVSAARNGGIAASSGEWIAFLDADDVWHPEKLEKQARYLEEHPGCEMVFCGYRNFTDIPDSELSERQKQIMSAVVPEYLVSACVKREVFDRYGLFDETLRFGEDTEWIARLRMEGADLSHRLDEIFYYRRVHTSNLTLSHSRLSRDEYLLLMAGAVRKASKGRKTPKDGGPK